MLFLTLFVGGSHWRNLVFPLESLFNEQCTSLKKKGCYVMSFSGDGRIVALAVNGRTASCCKMLFIDSSSDTTSVHPVYQSTEQGIGRFVGTNLAYSMYVDANTHTVCM